MKIDLTKEQKLVFNQQMQQSIMLLEMNSNELEDYINELSMENPMIEVVPPRERVAPVDRICSGGSTVDPDILSRTIANTPCNTLRDAVTEQINYLHIPELLRRE